MKLLVEHAVAWQMRHEDHGFEEPSRMRQVPFGGTGIRHRLHGGIAIREQHCETSARLPDGTIEQREFDRLQRGAKKVCCFHRSAILGAMHVPSSQEEQGGPGRCLGSIRGGHPNWNVYGDSPAPAVFHYASSLAVMSFR